MSRECTVTTLILPTYADNIQLHPNEDLENIHNRSAERKQTRSKYD